MDFTGLFGALLWLAMGVGYAASVVKLARMARAPEPPTALHVAEKRVPSSASRVNTSNVNACACVGSPIAPSRA